MKLSIILTAILAISCASKKESRQVVWELKENIKTPESVYQDPITKMIFVTSIDGEGTAKDKKGHISIISNEGKLIKANWLTGLNAPKGMRSYKNVLWVTDIDRLHAIDIKKAKKIGTIKVKGSIFLNDIAIDKNGDVYVSDTLTSKIHKISNGKVTTFAQGSSFDSPNGLLIKDGKLFVASWGFTTDWNTKIPGKLYTINLKNKKLNEIESKPFGNLDGLELDSKGNFIISDWMAGKVFRVSPDGKDVTEIYSTKKGSADIALVGNHILIPMMIDDYVQAVNLN